MNALSKGGNLLLEAVNGTTGLVGAVALSQGTQLFEARTKAG